MAAVSDDEEAPAPPPVEGVEMPAAPANIPEARPARVEVEEERFYDVIPRGVCIFILTCVNYIVTGACLACVSDPLGKIRLSLEESGSPIGRKGYVLLVWSRPTCL